jgi:hypothetical protein
MESKPQKLVHVYKVPSKLVPEVGVSSVGLSTLTTGEELMVFKLAGRGDAAKLASEMAKACIAEVDGRPMSTTDGSADSFWSSCHPKLRQLILTAYGNLHSPEAEETEDFLSSGQVRVG